jgi:hypothetical protein
MYSRRDNEIHPEKLSVLMIDYELRTTIFLLRCSTSLYIHTIIELIPERAFVGLHSFHRAHQSVKLRTVGEAT